MHVLKTPNTEFYFFFLFWFNDTEFFQQWKILIYVETGLMNVKKKIDR